MVNETRTDKAIKNTVCGIIFEIVSLLCGLILPRLILTRFGSQYNGLTSSITQFISCISLMKAGIGGVTRASLYKPLADKNYKKISEIVQQTEIFIRKISKMFIIFALILAFSYPIIIDTGFDFLFSSSLIIIISLSTFAQYYFGITYEMLLRADQKQYIIESINIFSTIVNTIIASVLLLNGFGIHVVKLASSIVYIIGPIFIYYYSRKKYHIIKVESVSQDYISQRWDAVGHEVSNFVNNNTDVIVLSMFSTLKIVSIYTVYQYVIRSIRTLITSAISGIDSAFGDMYAKGEYNILNDSFKIYELITFSSISIIYSSVFVLLTPYIVLYTKNINDANYFQPIFGYLLTVCGIFDCIRIPYEKVVKSFGHYRETRKYAITEAIINIVISLIAVIKFGLIGVTLGTLVACIYKTICYEKYLNKVLKKNRNINFIFHFFILLIILVLVVLCSNIINLEFANFYDWCISGFKVTLISIIFTIAADFIFFRKDFIALVKNVIK